MSHFEKVSFKQFKEDCIKLGYVYEDLEEIYKNIKLPSRGSTGSAGYDFYAPFDIKLFGIKVRDCATGQVYDEVEYNYLTLPTGIRWVTNESDCDKVLMCFPRSGQGFKSGLRLANSTGVIDCDYCNSANEGHIMLKITTNSPLVIESGKGMMQGIIMNYFLTDDDSTNGIRNGGFGSTDRR